MPWKLLRRPAAGPATAPDSFSSRDLLGRVAGRLEHLVGVLAERGRRAASGSPGVRLSLTGTPSWRTGPPRRAGRSRRPSRAPATSSESSASSRSSTGSRQQSCSSLNAFHSSRRAPAEDPLDLALGLRARAARTASRSGPRGSTPWHQALQNFGSSAPQVTQPSAARVGAVAGDAARRADARRAAAPRRRRSTAPRPSPARRASRRSSRRRRTGPRRSGRARAAPPARRRRPSARRRRGRRSGRPAGSAGPSSSPVRPSRPFEPEVVHVVAGAVACWGRPGRSR